MTRENNFLENSAIIVAHPDDEILWFGGIIADVDQVIIAYEDYWAEPDLGKSRAAALARFPRQVESLKLAEAGTYGMANWLFPEIDEFGLAFSTTEQATREIKRQIKSGLSLAVSGLPVASAPVRTLYEANFNTLYRALKPRLSADMNVFTHNPWGEYGHEDHVQMFRVLDKLRAEIGFNLWMSHYCTERAMPLALRYFEASPGSVIMRPVNKALCQQITDIYRDAGCWTWDDNWAWFDTETYRIAPSRPSDPVAHRHLGAINLFQID